MKDRNSSARVFFILPSPEKPSFTNKMLSIPLCVKQKPPPCIPLTEFTIFRGAVSSKIRGDPCNFMAFCYNRRYAKRRVKSAKFNEK